MQDIDVNRVVTPDTEPDRFTEEETAMFRRGECGWQIAYGLPWSKFCLKQPKPGASFGFCARHEAELLEDFYPDGTPRR